jgi:hypothetical protein
MRVRLISLALTLVALASFNAESRATTLLYDDFNGTALQDGMWPTVVSGGGSIAVADSVLTLNTSGGDWPAMNVYSAGRYGVDTVTTFKLGPNALSGCVNFGFYTGGSGEITIGNDRGAAGDWNLYVSDGASRSYLSSAFAFTPKANDVWKIVRTSDSIKVYDGANLVATDTTALPASDLQVHMSLYTGSGNTSVGFDSVTITTPAPEPSTAILLACGLAGILAYAWRKRK